MPLPTLSEIKQLANQILKLNPSPITQFRLIRDVLCLSRTELVYQKAQQASLNSPLIKSVIETRHTDGSWGYFHGSTPLKGILIPTTEVGVERLVHLGLQYPNPILDSTITYLVNLLKNPSLFPDKAEKNKRWRIGIQLFTANTLSLLSPSNPILDEIWQMWASILQGAFESGIYDPLAELKQHQKYTGLAGDLRYLMLDSKYQIQFLGSRATKLPESLIASYLGWLWNRPQGIRYLEVPFPKYPSEMTPGQCDRWFSELELLSLYPLWEKFAESSIQWIWTHRNLNGYWDVGKKASTSWFFPLSENWHIPQTRIIDWSTRVLLLLRRIYPLE